MLASSELPAPRLLPLMRYRDLAAAIDWLCEAFAFEKHVVVSATDGSIYYAQLTYGGGMVMLGTVRETDLDKLMRQPDEIGGIETQSCYLVVDDAEAHFARAVAAGAEIVLGIKSDGFGRRGYSCRDPQGHIWNFGTYNPWKGKPLPGTDAAEAQGKPAGARRRTAVKALLAVLALTGAAAWGIIGSGSKTTIELAGPASKTLPQGSLDALDEVQLRLTKATGAAERVFPPDHGDDQGTAKETASQPNEALQQELARERQAKVAAEQTAGAIRHELARERSEKEAALRAAQGLREQLTEQGNALQEAIRSTEEARLRLAKERDSKVAIERDARQIRELAAQAPAAEDTAERKPKVEVGQPAPIETSATEPGPASLPGQTPPAQSKWTVAAESVSPPDQRAATRVRNARILRARRNAQYPAAKRSPPAYLPTYMTELRDVPWPFSAWYAPIPLR